MLQEISQTVNNSQGLLVVVTFGPIFKADEHVKFLLHLNVVCTRCGPLRLR